MKYVTIFHANLNYAFLEPYKYETVIRASYETIIDVFREKVPDQRYTFEASGFTIDTIARLCPDVLEKLKDAIQRGQCEFMGAPYAHPTLANFPAEDGRWSLEFGMRAFEKHLGFRPESGWNPECSWIQFVPQIFKDVGYKYMDLDFESYMICNVPEYGQVERNPRFDMSWGGGLPQYDLDPDCKFLHFPFKDVVPGLGGFCRSDRLTNKAISYFMSRIDLVDYLEVVKKWSGTKDEGALLIIADDAEYCGTTAYYYVKNFGEYHRSFKEDPMAPEKLERLIKGVSSLGQMITFKEACELPPVAEKYYVEDGFAWHRTYACVWANTPESKRFDPIIARQREELRALEANARPEHRQLVEETWFHLTNSENSDGRWPPPPAKTCPFNVDWVENEIKATDELLAKLRTALGG